MEDETTLVDLSASKDTRRRRGDKSRQVDQIPSQAPSFQPELRGQGIWGGATPTRFKCPESTETSNQPQFSGPLMDFRQIKVLVIVPTMLGTPQHLMSRWKG